MDLLAHEKPILELVNSQSALNALLRSKFRISRDAARDALRTAVRAGRVQYIGTLDSPAKSFVPAP